MIAGRGLRPRLAFEQANSICKEFVPIGDAVFFYIEGLETAGFSSFVPYDEFVRSFCGGESDIESHKRYLIESAKYIVGRPFPFPIGIDEKKWLFTSSFIEELVVRRDEENGVPVSQLASRFPDELWRLEVDPCRRRSVFAKMRDRVVYNDRWNMVSREVHRRFASEVLKHSTGLAERYSFERHERLAFFKAVMEENAARLSFVFDKRKSTRRIPVFSKNVNEDWDLCWAIEDPKMLSLDDFKGRLSLRLEIRGRDLKGSVERAQAGEFLIIRHDHIVPGFFNAYGQFGNLDELETIIKAHLRLFELMAPTIEAGLTWALREKRVC